MTKGSRQQPGTTSPDSEKKEPKQRTQKTNVLDDQGSEEEAPNALFSAAVRFASQQTGGMSVIGADPVSTTVQTSKRSNGQPSKDDEPTHRLTVYMPIPLHKRFKKHSIDIERDMSEIVVELIETYMREQAGET
jgi:hypothetical protein